MWLNDNDFLKFVVTLCCCCLVAKLCPTLCNPMDCSLQWHPTAVLLPGKSHGQRSLEGCSPWGHWGSDTTEWLHFHFSLSCIGGNCNPPQCSCLENPRDRGAWWAAIYGVAQSWTQLMWLSSSSSRLLYGEYLNIPNLLKRMDVLIVECRVPYMSNVNLINYKVYIFHIFIDILDILIFLACL